MEPSNNTGGWFSRAKQMFGKLIGSEPTKATQQSQQKSQPALSAEDQTFLDGVFGKVSKMVRNSTSLTQDQQLIIYGLFKQANEGDNNRDKPAFYEMEASAKHASWEKCRGLSKTEAKQLYIKHANVYDESIGKRLMEQLQNPSAESEFSKDEKGTLGSLSRPQTQEEPTYSHPYIAAMEKGEPIEKLDHALLLTMNKQPQILPLHYAIDNQLVAYVRQFVKALDKSEVNLPDGQGMTALQYAELMENEQILQIIKSAL